MSRFFAGPAQCDGGRPYFDRARELAPLVEAEAARGEALGTMPPEVVDAMKQEGMFWMLVPGELGGGGLDVVSAIEVIEEVTRADGSTGWSLMANSLATALAGAFCTDVAVDEMFSGNAPPIVAGMLGPGGRSVEVPGGFNGGGKYKFGSGCAHSNWVGAGMLVMGDDGPKNLPTGNPIVRVCFLRRDKVEVTGDWEPIGLVATGSYDYVVPEQFVSADFTMERTERGYRRGAPHFSLGIAGMGCAGHTAVALGLMRRSLEEIVGIVREKKRPGYATVIADDPVFRHAFSTHEASFQAARTLALEVFRAAQEAAATGELSDVHRQRLHQVMTWTHDVGAEVVKFAHTWAGSNSIGRASVLGRCMRDMFVATQHVFVDSMSLVNAAPVIMTDWLTAANRLETLE